MKKKQRNVEYQPGKIKALVEHLARLIKEKPHLADDLPVLHSLIAANVEGYGKRDRCLNCSRSMKISLVRPNHLHTILLDTMAKSVRAEVRKGVPFTQANRTHIDRLAIPTSIKKQQSNLSYLGLIAQPSGTKRSGYWVITHWGWKALRGESFPDHAKMWNKKLIARSETMTTFPAVNEAYSAKLAQQARYGRAVKMADYRSQLAGFNPVEWAEYAGVVGDSQGSMGI